MSNSASGSQSGSAAGTGTPQRAAPTTESEKVKYEKMWELPQYRGNRANTFQVDAFIKLAGIPAGSSVIDIGCGPGYASVRFHERGMRVIAIDIASNALEPDAAKVVEFHCCSIWELPGGVTADYGFCTDMMEHIPTDKIDMTLAAIAGIVKNDVFFDISLRPDGCGRLINDVLHLTVKPLEWWIDTLRAHWPHVEVIKKNDEDKSAMLIVRPRKHAQE